VPHDHDSLTVVIVHHSHDGSRSPCSSTQAHPSTTTYPQKSLR
jgi:hypothetical protein